MSDLLGPAIGERQPERKSASHGEAGYERRPLDPKSLVEYDPDDKTFAMPEWLAAEKGLI